MPNEVPFQIYKIWKGTLKFPPLSFLVIQTTTNFGILVPNTSKDQKPNMKHPTQWFFSFFHFNFWVNWTFGKGTFKGTFLPSSVSMLHKFHTNIAMDITLIRDLVWNNSCLNGWDKAKENNLKKQSKDKNKNKKKTQ